MNFQLNKGEYKIEILSYYKAVKIQTKYIMKQIQK